MTKKDQPEGGAGGGGVPYRAKRGSFRCTNIFLHETVMFSYSFRAKSVFQAALYTCYICSARMFNT